MRKLSEILSNSPTGFVSGKFRCSWIFKDINSLFDDGGVAKTNWHKIVTILFELDGKTVGVLKISVSLIAENEGRVFSIINNEVNNEERGTLRIVTDNINDEQICEFEKFPRSVIDLSFIKDDQCVGFFTAIRSYGFGEWEKSIVQ